MSKKPVKKNAKKAIKKTEKKPVKKYSPQDLEMVKNIGIVYERVKFNLTGEARIVVSRKSPEKSINFEHLLKFTKLAKAHDILPNFYFHSLYNEGEKVIQSKPECAFLNKKTNLHYYSEYIKRIICDEPDKDNIVNNLLQSEKNMEMFCLDNNVEHKEDGYKKDFFKINHLNREYPDWIIMMKLGIISPYLLFLNDDTLKFAKFLKIKNQNNSIEVYIKHYNELNKNGKLKELLTTTFRDFI